MPEPRVISVMAEFKRGLLMRESAQQNVMVKRWMQVEACLMGDMQALGEEIARTATSGTIMTESQLMRNERYRALLAQTRVEISQYQTWADRLISNEQAGWHCRSPTFVTSSKTTLSGVRKQWAASVLSGARALRPRVSLVKIPQGLPAAQDEAGVGIEPAHIPSSDAARCR